MNSRTFALMALFLYIFTWFSARMDCNILSCRKHFSRDVNKTLMTSYACDVVEILLKHGGDLHLSFNVSG